MSAKNLILSIAAAALLITGCRLDMQDAPRYDAFEASALFADGMSARQPVEGTVAVGELNEDTLFLTGMDNGELSDVLPFAMTRADLDRGHERYNIFCSPCHAHSGNGNGMIVQRGFKKPTSLHDPRLREAKLGYFFDVMTNGFGVMYSYKSRISAADRWRIAAYIRTLQFSQNATMADVPPEDQWLLTGVK